MCFIKRNGSQTNFFFLSHPLCHKVICSLPLISQSDNSLYNPEDDTAIAFAPWGGGAEINEPGYARVGSPSGPKGYAHLKPTPERCRSEYMKLLKPSEGMVTNCTWGRGRGWTWHTCTSVYVTVICDSFTYKKGRGGHLLKVGLPLPSIYLIEKHSQYSQRHLFNNSSGSWLWWCLDMIVILIGRNINLTIR